jgi:hypothetical protein
MFLEQKLQLTNTICHAQNCKEPEVITEGPVIASSAVYSWWLFEFFKKHNPRPTLVKGVTIGSLIVREP